LKNKLSETEKVVYNSQLDKRSVESRLDQTIKEYDETNKKYIIDNDESNRRINLLQQELKELQNKLNE